MIKSVVLSQGMISMVSFSGLEIIAVNYACRRHRKGISLQAFVFMYGVEVPSNLIKL